MDWQPKSGSSFGHLRKEYFVNLSPFPTQFRTEDDALLSYNDLGQWHKIQFKIGHRKRNDAGIMIGFTLVCTKRQMRSFGKIDQGLQLKDYGCLNCPVMVRFKWRNDKCAFIRSSRMIMHHTHELDMKERSNINNKHIQSEIQLYIETNIAPHQIHTLINEKYQTNVSFEQIYHMVLNIQSSQRKETQSDIQQLIQQLEQMKRVDPNLRFAYEYDEGDMKDDIYQMIVQTSEMRRNYRNYHDIVFMDATYKTNHHSLALTVFSGINNEGKNVVLGFALVKRETMETYKWLLTNLLRFNENIEPGVILTDFDASMCGAIEQTFKKTTHLLCQWHMQQNFKKHFIYLKRIHKGIAKLLYKYIVYDLIYQDNQKVFETYLDIIFQNKEIIGESKINYLRNLLIIKEKWTSAYAPNIFLARTHTTSRAESMNSQIKARVHSQSNLVEIFNMFQDLEQRVVDRSISEQRNETKLMVNHPFLSELYELYTRYAFELMLHQYMNCHELVITSDQNKILKDVTPGIFYVKDKKEKVKYNVGIRQIEQEICTDRLFNVDCNCKFFWLGGMLCAHIFAVLNQLQVKSLSQIKPFERWTKRIQWENYAQQDLEIQPYNPLIENKILQLEQKPLESLHNNYGYNQNISNFSTEDATYTQYSAAMVHKREAPLLQTQDDLDVNLSFSDDDSTDEFQSQDYQVETQLYHWSKSKGNILKQFYTEKSRMYSLSNRRWPHLPGYLRQAQSIEGSLIEIIIKLEKMRALFVLDANSEEIIYGKRFPTVEQRLKQFYQSSNNEEKDSQASKLFRQFEYIPLPDNAIFKLAFSRQVIQKQKLENEKKSIFDLQDYKLDYEDWEQMQESIQRQLNEELEQILVIKKDNQEEQILFKNQSILSLKVNLSHQQIGEIWPVIYTKAKSYYFLVAVVSIIEDQIFNMEQIQDDNITQREAIKLLIEEKQPNIILTIEYLQKIQELLVLNQDQINQEGSNFWDWFSLLIEMTVPFGTIKSNDFASYLQMIKASSMMEVEIMDEQDNFQTIQSSKNTKQNEWSPNFKFKQRSSSSNNQAQSQSLGLMLLTPFDQSTASLEKRMTIAQQLSHSKQKQETLYIDFSEEIYFVQKSYDHSYNATQGIIVGKIRCHADFNSKCEITMSLSSQRALYNPQTNYKCVMEDVDGINSKLQNSKFIFSAVPFEWIQILSYEIPITMKEGVLPFSCKYQFKQISQNEIKIWIKLQLHSQLQSNSLRILIPLFNVLSISKVDIKCSIGTVSRIQHYQDNFQCLLWTVVPFNQIHMVDISEKQELQASIFIGEEHLGNKALLEDHYDSQYEDILLRSYDQLQQQNEQELTVESSENYNYLNKECLNVSKAFQELKTKMANFTDDELSTASINSKSRETGQHQTIAFTDIDQNNDINNSSSGAFGVGGLSSGVSKSKWSEEMIMEGINKRPYLIDKQTYIKIEFIGVLGQHLMSQIEINKVLFYPHRDGILIQKKEEIRTAKYIVWNSLAFDGQTNF